MCLVSGEPGIGKSRLADELATRAQARGARVLWGRCWEAGGAPAYWPWVQAIRSYVRGRDPTTLLSQLGPGAADIGQMIPELHDLFPEVRTPSITDPEGSRFRLFDSTTAFLRSAARGQPLVFVLDDLHASDASSLLLLQFVASELEDAHILIIGNYRDEGLAGLQLATTLADLERFPVTRHIQLRGLDQSESARLIESILDGAAPETLVVDVHRETEGNPLFVAEVIRLLSAEGKLEDRTAAFPPRIAVPARVREVIGRRLDLLSERCREVLGLASVLGREFRLDALAEVGGLPAVALLEVIDEARAARVVIDAPAGIGRMRFSHALVRDVLYDDLTAAQRTRAHQMAGEALEGLYVDDPEPHLAELAHQFCEALPGGDVDKAVDYARRAGERAATLLAYEEGARLFRLALDVLELKGQPGGEAHCRLLLALGDSLAREGNLAGAKEAFLQAAAVARRLGIAEALADAALGYGGRFVWGRGSDAHLMPLLREALAALPDGDSAIRARVMARLAGALRDQTEREPRDRLSDEAVGMARRIDDPATLSYALEGRFSAVWGPENAEERLAIATEILDLATKAGEGERIAQGLDFRTVVFIERGEMALADAELDAMGVIVEQVRQPAQTWIHVHARAMRALLDGRFEDAEQLISEALEVGTRAQPWDALITFKIQTYLLRREQGRLDELEPIIRRSVAEYPTRPLFASLLSHLYSELDRPIECGDAFDRLAANAFAVLPRDGEWLFALSFLPEVADFLHDRDRAALLYDLLAPYGERCVAATAIEASTGSIARGLGILASTLGRWDEAAGHFDEGLQRNRVMGARPWVARTEYSYARMLLGRDEPGDRERAAGLLAEAAETCDRLGMQALAQQVAVVQQAEGISADVIDPRRSASPETSGRNFFRREGDYWTIEFDNDAFRLRDSKGLRYLAQLLASPNREFLALELVTAGSGSRSIRPPGTADRDRIDSGLQGSPGRGDELLDVEATSAYRRRLEELQDELEEAERRSDSERAARAGSEMEFLTRELARAVGLGGKGRRAPSDAERARVNVTKAIRASVARIDAHSRSLGRHLASTIRTGTFCSYSPDPRAPAAWRL